MEHSKRKSPSAEVLERKLSDSPKGSFPNVSLNGDDFNNAAESLRDADEALTALAGREPLEVDEPTNQRLLRKIDFNLMPLSKTFLFCMIDALLTSKQ
jgi:hypothetical protein